MRGEIDILLAGIDDAFSGKSWHGPNLKGSLRGVSAEEAAWRPRPGRHNIWELAVHASYWKYAVRRRLLNEKRGSFVLKGSNWFARPQNLTQDAWRDDLRVLTENHERLRDAIAALDPGQLHKSVPGSRYSCAKLILGVTAHDVYHTGQITLIKRLMKSR